MTRLIRFFIQQSLFGDLLTLAIIGIGIWSLLHIRREVFPNVQYDVILVRVIYPGGTAAEVEKLISFPMEQELKGVDGIKRLQSISIDNQSRLLLWLDPDETTEARAKEDVQDIANRFIVPAGAERPIVTAVGSKQNPVIQVSISGDLPVMELREKAKWLGKELESVPGVSAIANRGLRDLEIRVEADLQKLRKYGVSLEELILSLKKQNVSIPGGVVDSPSAVLAEGTREHAIRTVGDFKDVEDVKKSVIRSNEVSNSVRVGDVANVFYDLKREQIVTRTNGKDSISLTILKKDKGDAIDLVDSVKAKVEELKPKLGPGIEVSFINDYSQFIRRRLSILTGNFGLGLLLVILFLPFLIPMRFAAIIAIGEPFAFLGTIVILYWFGFSINMISMIGLIIVSGILVDDSIVVTENSARLVEEGLSPQEAAIVGTRQIVAPLTASVLATMASFLPMAFVSGIFGKFIVEIPIVVITALLVSLLETFFILPGHVAHWIRPQDFKPKASGLISKITDASQRIWQQRIMPAYLRWLDFALSHRYKVIAGMAAIFAVTGIVAAKKLKVVLFPAEDVEIFFIRTETPSGVPLTAHAEALLAIEERVAELPRTELENFTTTVGLVQQDPNDPNTQRGPEYAQIAVFLTPEGDRDRTAFQIIDELRQKVGTPTGFKRVAFQRVNPGPPVGKPINIGVRGRDYDEINAAVADIKERLGKIDGIEDINDTHPAVRDEYQVNVRNSEAAAAGVGVSDVGTTVRAAFEGIIATAIRNLDEHVDVRVSLEKDQRESRESLEALSIPNPRGALIPLSQIATIQDVKAVSSFEHENHMRQVRILAEVNTAKVTSLQANHMIQKLVPELKLKHPNVEFAFGGEASDTRESLRFLKRAFIISLIAIFLILVMTFRSLLQPLVTMATVPFGVISVIWALLVHGLPLSFMAILGIIALSGIIVNNGIVFIDFVNQRRSEGADRWQSLRDAASVRIRPIFLTTITTIIGVIPTAYGIGGMDKFVVPIAMTLGWGLLFGSVLTAFVFPPLLAILDDITALKFRKRP